MQADVVFYVSGHGFGHATRTAALIRALVERSTRTVSVAVRTEAPHWIFEQRVAGIRCSAATIDIGLLQPNGLEIDLPRSLSAHEEFGERWDEAVEREAHWIKERGAKLVVADVPALAFDAAARASVPAVGVTNFGWDWILDLYAAAQPRWQPIVERYADAYRKADRCFRLPLAGDLSSFGRLVDAPLLVNRSVPDRAACRASIGIRNDEARRVVVVSFGGLGQKTLHGEVDDLDDYLFVGVGDRPTGLRADWITVPDPTQIAHEQLICASDAVLGKPGFSTVAEILAHERRFAFVARQGFRENDVLVDHLAQHATACEIPRADFEAGHWRSALDALFDAPAPPPAPPCDGAEFVANALLETLSG